MSRTLLALLAALVGVAGIIVWSLMRTPHPSELAIAPQEQPVLPEPIFAAEDWPFWRGPASNGHSPESTAPTSWSETENIRWKTAIPGRGHSSPILIGNNIFLTSADETAERQLALCLDRTSGKILWDKTIHEKNFPPKHQDNSHASSTPASDGERLFVAFANGQGIQVSALDQKGEIVWRCEAGPHATTGGCHGYGSSLALWGAYVIVCDDSPLGGKGWIAAVHRQTGQIARRTPRRTGAGSYGSPVVATLDGKPLVLLAGNSAITAYDPRNGDEVWRCADLAETSANTVAFSSSMAFGSSGYPKRKLLAVNSSGVKVWGKEGKGYIPYPPSLLWADGFLYMAGDDLAACLDASTGEEKWRERVPGSYYASPLLVGKYLYLCNRDGVTTICEANPQAYVEVKRNKLERGISASPVAIGGKLYIRTESHLYCIGK